MANLLTLQITRDNFEYILDGQQKVEHRFVYPSNEKRYLEILEDGEEKHVLAVKYDGIKFINGRKKDAPRMVVEILGADWVVLTDPDTGEDLTFVENGVTYVQSLICYKLGRVLSTENMDGFENKYVGKVDKDGNPYHYENDHDAQLSFSDPWINYHYKK